MSGNDEDWDALEERLASARQTDDIASAVLAMVRHSKIPFQSCVILLREHGKLVPVLNETPYRDVLAMAHLLDRHEPLVDEVLESSQTRLAGELPVGSEERIFKEERSVVCVPLLVKGRSIGVLYLGALAAHVYEAQHSDKLEVIGALAASSLDSVLPVEPREKTPTASERKSAQLDALRDLSRKLSVSLKAAEITRAVVSSIKLMVSGVQSVILFTRDTDDATGHALKAEYADTPFADYVRNQAPRNDEGLLGKAIAFGETILVSDTEMFDVQNILGSEHSVIVAPLFGGYDGDGDEFEREINAGLLGCLYVGSATENTFKKEQREIVETISYLLTMALKNARLFEQTQQMSLTDGLTGLYTHRLFHDKLAEEIEYASRHDQFVVLVMVDADNFARYNDTLGHAAGDALLKEIASLLKDKVRAADIVCRYGGDEFALLLKNTRKADAVRMCERIREAFQLRFGGNAVQVTASIGLACYPVDADHKQDLMRLASDALQASRGAGGNRVTAGKRAPGGAADSPGDDGEPPWSHHHTSPRKPPPKNVPGQGSRKME